MYCGFYGCRSVVGRILAGGSVSVKGSNGAYQTNIEAGDDIECAADYSCAYSNIKAESDIFIEANYAASYATITGGDAVTCDASYSCQRATISAEGSIDSSGEYATYYGDITSGETIWVRGYYGAWYSTIEASEIFIYGYYGAGYADINQPDGSALNLYLYGYKASYGADIYCLNEDETCYVHCGSKYACQQSQILYSNLDEVNLYPTDCGSFSGTVNDDGIYCPTLTLYDEDTTDIASIKAAKKEIVEASHDYNFIESNVEHAWEHQERARVENDEKREAAFKAIEEDRLAGEDNHNPANDDHTPEQLQQLNVALSISDIGVQHVTHPLTIYGAIGGSLIALIFMLIYSKCGTCSNNKNYAKNEYQPLL